MSRPESLRIEIVRIARTWVGTKFHDRARIKGVGVDCVQLVAAVYEESGALAHVETPDYSPQFFLHKKGDERLIAEVMRYDAHEIEEINVGPGDLVLYKMGHSFAHAAIVADWPNEIIHAHGLSRGVIAGRPFEHDLAGRSVKFFSLW
jgi:cell wall-associated NlpC family hydrolase